VATECADIKLFLLKKCLLGQKNSKSANFFLKKLADTKNITIFAADF
jgi:hypothetical protein